MTSENTNSFSFRELNYLVYLYLEKSGFEHSASCLENEADINDETLAPAEALITLVHKGLQYLEMEANVTKDKTDEDFIFLEAFDLITKNIDELKQIVEQKKKLKSAEDSERVVEDTHRENKDDRAKGKLNEPETPETSGGPEPMILPAFAIPPRCGVRSSDILILNGHSEEVWACDWSPAGSLLASGAGDCTARIWSIADRHNNVMNRLANVRVLMHGKYKRKRNDIPSLSWNLDGTLLATGSYDGLARIWNTDGELKNIFRKHKDRISSVKWNKKGDYLLTGSYDRSTIAWIVQFREVRQQFKLHSGPVLDVDWRTNDTFASCSTDSTIYVCKIGEIEPVKLFSGHMDEVNCVKWDPSGIILASCSDDTTVKVWSMNQDLPILDFKDHTSEVYTIRWCPIGSGTDNSNTKLLLASGSFDFTVKIWDVEAGTLFHSLNGHGNAVFCISFSPNGKYLATGSEDKLVHIWSVNDGVIMKTYYGNGPISQVSWSNDGRKIAYSTRNKNVCVSDVRL